MIGFMELAVVGLLAGPGASLRTPLVARATHPRWEIATVAGATVGVAALLDRHVEEENDESNPRTTRDVARAVRPFGNGIVLGSGIVLTYGAGRLFHDSALTRAAIRIGASDAAAGILALAVKQGVGRARPEDAPGNPWRFRPFSGDASFPSGHATLAFATAVAVDEETKARWVPWLVYPMATIVGWSRVHDDEHWTSDVVAGAALGALTSALVERRLHRGLGLLERFAWQVRPEAGGVALQVTLRESDH